MGACVFTIVIPSLKIDLLLLYNVLLYLFWEFLTFKSILSDIGMATLFSCRYHLHELSFSILSLSAYVCP